MSSNVDWPNFRSRLEEISRAAAELVAAGSVGMDLQAQVRHKLGATVNSSTRELLSVSRSLADWLVSGSLLEDEGLRAILSDGEVTSDRAAQVHSDLLSSVWLGLYFLGMPFNDTWERAMRLVEHCGGFSRGACIDKAIGDVFRSTRKILTRDHAISTEPAIKRGDADQSLGAVVLTRRPLALLPLDSSEKDVFALLGRCYVLLQLRLYIDANLPLTYIVPAEDFVENLSVDTKLDSAADWLMRIAGPCSRKNQHLVVPKNDQKAVHGVPTCVLGHKHGIYTLERPQDNIPFAGNRIWSGLVVSYRSRLWFSDERYHRIDWDVDTELKRRLREVRDGHRAETNGRPPKP